MVLINSKKSGNEVIGQYFTPNYIAKFMVKNILKFIKEVKLEPQNLKVLEPSVGKGIFIKFLIQDNFADITAYEIDKILKYQLLNAYPGVNFTFENVLGSDINDKYDLIIGNPPYLGQNYNAGIFQEYVKKFPICEEYFMGNMDLFYYFIHLGILKLNPGGFLSFITTNYWITKSKKTGIKLLKPHILEECFLLQHIDLSNIKVFKGAQGQHNCIFILRKKTEHEKLQNIDSPIEIIQIRKKKNSNQLDDASHERIFSDLIQNKKSKEIIKYQSALTNKDLKREGSWNIIYPKEVKKLVDKIEKVCAINNKISLLKDYFIIRNGLIFIKDEVFILKEDYNLKVENGAFYVKINDRFLKLNENEKKRLKKIYKSKSVESCGYNKKNYAGYAIYFNKNDFTSHNIKNRNLLYEKRYPVLTEYLKQFENELKGILVNAKENPNDLFFPRRGTYIRRRKNKHKEKLIDLESMYDKGKKIFFRYISNNNIFGYTDDAYLATSDTYFLWPKSAEREIDYLFILAYLNSKIVDFLFKAKNIKIKRSKTKLEYGLPIPNLNNFISEKDVFYIALIKFLVKNRIEISRLTNNFNLDKLQDELSNLADFSYFNQAELMHEIISALGNLDDKFLKKTIDNLFFQLFNLKEEEIDYLINKYY